MEEHLQGAVNRPKKAIQHVIEKFQKRGIKISACKPRALIFPASLPALETVKSGES